MQMDEMRKTVVAMKQREEKQDTRIHQLQSSLADSQKQREESEQKLNDQGSKLALCEEQCKVHEEEVSLCRWWI